MKVQPELASLVREMSEVTDLPVDTILEEALESWVRLHSPTYISVAADIRSQMQSSRLLSMTRHEGTEFQ